MKKVNILCILGLWSIIGIPSILAQTLAFPEATGFGRFSEGGRGGEVIFVTNLDDNGPGSLREACEADGPRTIIFKVGGTISLNSTIEIQNPFITIAGQTAPGGGICLRMATENNFGHLQATLAILADHVIIRGIRFRAGPSLSPPEIEVFDCLDIWDGENIIIDHCSFTWGEDENIAIWSSYPNETPQKITIQKSIIGQGLMKLSDGELTRGFGLLVGGTIGADQLSIIDNLFIHNLQRNPLLKTEQTVVNEMYNNIIYNYGFFGTDLSDDVNLNLVGNMFIPGVNTSTNRYEVLIQQEALLYVESNIGPNRMDDSALEWDIVGFNGTIPPDGYAESPAPLSFQSETPFTEIPQNLLSADEAYAELIATMDIGASYKLSETGDGTFVTNSDEIDLGLIEDLINKTGSSIFDFDIGSTVQYPELATGIAPSDSDEDGMPDMWENSCGLDINDPSDRNIIASNNYTNLENYLNGVSCNVTNTEEILDMKISFSPNPTNGIIKLSGEFDGEHDLKIYDVNGKLILMRKIRNADQMLDLSELAEGSYFISIDGIKESMKLMIQK